MSEAQNIQWYPGHMTKTKRKITESLKLVDAVAEIIDARIPLSSRNPDIDRLIGGKPRIILLNKCDMASEAETVKWLKSFKSSESTAIAVDCKTGKGLNAFIPSVRSLLKDKIAGWEAKGMTGRTIKVMVVGIPNVGKSSFINKMARYGKAKAEDRPGVTRGNQWFTIGKGFDLLDTPGVLWPKFDDRLVGERLAFTGAVRDEITDTVSLSSRLLEYLNLNYNDELRARYKITSDTDGLTGDELLLLVAKNRGMMIRGGEADAERAAITVLDEFRAAKIGRITIEKQGV